MELIAVYGKGGVAIARLWQVTVLVQYTIQVGRRKVTSMSKSRDFQAGGNQIKTGAENEVEEEEEEKEEAGSLGKESRDRIGS
ncbi:hypothetical protein PV325_013983 [Microctonus aethiopoides]|nr:hypothetical protein PV325_013983 [Microctonus aethiopoides]